MSTNGLTDFPADRDPEEVLCMIVLPLRDLINSMDGCAQITWLVDDPAAIAECKEMFHKQVVL